MATETSSLDPGSGFESYAAALYGRPGVAEACLELQERVGADVNLVLLACWLAARGVRLDGPSVERLRAVAEAWRQAVVGPLRRARRSLRPLVAELATTAHAERAAALRSKVAAAELEAERLVERLLEDAAAGLRSGWPADRATAAANLERLLGDPPPRDWTEVVLGAAFER